MSQIYPLNKDLIKDPIIKITDVYIVIIEKPTVSGEYLSDTIKNISPKIKNIYLPFAYPNYKELPA